VQQNYIQNMGQNQNTDNIMGIIFLPKNPLFFKNQPFYIKKLCGVSILERNINILIKNGIREIFILSESSVDFNNEMNFDSSKFDQLFRKFDGRRNIYTLHILIFGIFGHFQFVIFSICIHAIITSIIYSIQAIKHLKKVDNLNLNKITKTIKGGYFNEEN